MKSQRKIVFGVQLLGAFILIAMFASGCVSRRQSKTYSLDAPDYRGGSNAEVVAVPVSQPTVARTRPGRNQVSLRSQLVSVTKHSPATATVGQDFANTIVVEALTHIGDVELTHYVPAGAQFVKAEPSPGSVSGKKLVWNWKELKADEQREVKIWIKPTAEGELRSCSTIHALPFGCIITRVGKPAISVEKTGPARVEIGEKVTYNIVVRNTGTSPAYKVEVTDTIPSGMSHESGKRELVFDAGDLQPGDAKQATVVLTANERGTFTNRVVANSSNAGSASDTVVTEVVQAGVKIVNSGPPQQCLGKSATYDITVSNTGDTTLEGVAVVDTAPPNTSILDAPGAQVSGNQAVWSVGTLAAGQSESFTIDLHASEPGVAINKVGVTTNGGLSENAQAQTLWLGFAAVLVEMVDDPDPLLIGQSTTYTLKVTNQGTAADHDVSIVVNFPPQITPTETGGITAGDIQGNKVVFAPLAIIAPKQVATWTITAKATAVGDGRIAAEITTRLLKSKPVTEVEATQVY